MDRDRLTQAQAASRFESFRVTIVCGPEIANSPTLQAALLTAVNVANKVRRGCVQVVLPEPKDRLPVLLPWPAPSLVAGIAQVAPEVRYIKAADDNPRQILLGTSSPEVRGLQVTFNGWSAAVGPSHKITRLPEEERCVLAGVLAGALAVSEVFMATFAVQIEATTRIVGLSLWRPDLSYADARAVGPAVQYGPGEIWSLGLGHLGQAYLWCLSLLRYEKPEDVRMILQDFDRTVRANVGTCALTAMKDLGIHKTRVCRRWLEARGLRPAVVERRFDELTKCGPDEPALALCGFDGNGPRHLLDDAGFRAVVETGLGGRFDNFDSILMHALPRANVKAAEFWKPRPQTVDPVIEELLRDHPSYHDGGAACGVVQLELASRAVAVPFVGAAAASLVVAETLRMAHGGARFEKVDLRLASPKSVAATRSPTSYADRATKVLFLPVG
jgi:hypothetical protein